MIAEHFFVFASLSGFAGALFCYLEAVLIIFAQHRLIDQIFKILK